MVLGGLVGLAALTRGEALFLCVLLVLPLVLLIKGISWRRKLGLLGLAAAGSRRRPRTMGDPQPHDVPGAVPDLDQQRRRVLVSNCQQTYYGSELGAMSFSCPGGGVPASSSRSPWMPATIDGPPSTSSAATSAGSPW